MTFTKEDLKVLAFDAYGTLLSTESIATRLASLFGEQKANTIAQKWRKYQLEYTWRLNSMNKYEPFTLVTKKSLVHALAEAEVSLPATEIDSLMASYNVLSPFPDVFSLFTHLSNHSNIHAVVFSNGTNSMISSSLQQSKEVSLHAHLFKDIVVVEPVKKFKPHPDVYAHLIRSVKKQGREGDVWLISGNPFDIVGANAYGLSTCWVDRQGKGWVDGLISGKKGVPTVIVRGLHEVVERIENKVSETFYES